MRGSPTRTRTSTLAVNPSGKDPLYRLSYRGMQDRLGGTAELSRVCRHKICLNRLAGSATLELALSSNGFSSGLEGFKVNKQPRPVTLSPTNLAIIVLLETSPGLLSLAYIKPTAFVSEDVDVINGSDSPSLHTARRAELAAGVFRRVQYFRHSPIAQSVERAAVNR